MTAAHLHATSSRSVAVRLSLFVVVLIVASFFAFRVAESLRADHGARTVAGPVWRQNGLAGVTVHAVALSSRRAGLMFAGTEPGVYRRDPGGSWHRVLTSQAVWDVQLLPDDRTVIAGDNSGYVSVSADAGAHWRKSLVTPQGVYAVAARPGHAAWLLAGAGGGIYLSRDGGRHWTRRISMLGSGVDTFSWQPGSDQVVFAGSVAGTSQAQAGVFVSRDAGLSWRRYGRNLHSRAGVMSLVVTSPNRLFAGTMGNAVWLARGPSSDWKKIPRGMPPTNDHVAGLATIPGQPETLFAATLGAGVFRTDDGGLHWSVMSRGLPGAGNATIVLAITYSPLTHVLEAGTTDGVYDSTVLSRCAPPTHCTRRPMPS